MKFYVHVIHDGKILVSCDFNCRKLGLMDSEVKERIFEYLEKLGALRTNKNMIDGVFEIYLKIKNVSERKMIR